MFASNREDINRTQDGLLGLNSHHVKDGLLVLYEENQGACRWGVKAGTVEDDPAVRRGIRAAGKAELEWEQDHERLSEFLTAMLFWQSVDGAMPYCGVGTADSARIAGATGWEGSDLGDDWESRVLLRDGQVLLISGDGPLCYAGGRTREDFLMIEKTFNVEWDYSTLDEESREE